MKPALVVGAGLSGLATAWCLADRGFDVAVVEAASRPGGLIHTAHTPFGPAETGANAFVWSGVVESWFARLALAPVFARPESARRYIFRDGRPRRWPLTVTESASLVFRAGLAAATRGFAARDMESVADWGNRVVGAGARRWLLEPAMQGIYAAPADRLSARAIFGGRRRGRPRMAAPEKGMGAFVERLYETLTDRGVRFLFDTPVSTLDPGCATAVCCGAPEAARLVAAHAPDVADEMARIAVSGLATATVFLERDEADLRGFGVLFPAGTGVAAMGVLINTDIFDHRGSVRSETWIYGPGSGALAAWSDERFVAAIEADRQMLTGRRGRVVHAVVTRWPAAIPVYDAAILRLQAVQPTLPPWLALAGNYLGVIGVSRLLEVADAAAARLDGGDAESRGP